MDKPYEVVLSKECSVCQELQKQLPTETPTVYVEDDIDRFQKLNLVAVPAILQSADDNIYYGSTRVLDLVYIMRDLELEDEIPF